MSHVAAPAAVRMLLARTGFAIEVWEDVTQAGREWVAKRATAAPPAHGVTVARLLGEANAAGVANMPRNLDEGRIALVEAIARKAPVP